MKKIWTIKASCNLFDKIIISKNQWLIYYGGSLIEINPYEYNLELMIQGEIHIVNCEEFHNEYLRLAKFYPKGYDQDLVINKESRFHAGMAISLTHDYPKKYIGISLSLKTLCDINNFSFLFGHEIGHYVHYSIYGAKKVELTNSSWTEKAQSILQLLVSILIALPIVIYVMASPDMYSWLKVAVWLSMIGILLFINMYYTICKMSFPHRDAAYREEYFADRYSQLINKDKIDINQTVLNEKSIFMYQGDSYTHPNTEARLDALSGERPSYTPFFINHRHFNELSFFHKRL